MRKVEAFILIVLIWLICPASLLAQQSSRLVRADSISNYTFNNYRIVGKEGVFQFSEPQLIAVYPGESFCVEDSCFIWRDSILLNSYCDTLFYGSGKDSKKVRATSIGGVLKLTTGSKIEYKSGWKPKLLSLFNDSIINVDSLMTLSVNGTSSVNNIKVTLFADSIEISMPKGDYDSCLVINETVDNRLCVVTHAGDTVKISLGDLGIVHTDSSYIFRIHAAGLPPCYFNYPIDLLRNTPNAPTWLDIVFNKLLSFRWIGLIITLIVLIIIVSAFFYRKKKISLAAKMSVQKENGEERIVDSMERIKQHLNTIYEEYVMISKLVNDEAKDSELSDSEPVEKEVTKTNKMYEQMDESKNREKNSDTQLIMNSDISSLVSILGDNIDKLSEIINDKYQSLSFLRTQLEMKEKDLEKAKEERDEYNTKFQGATSIISTMKEERLAVAQEHEKTVNQLKSELEQEKACTKQKVKEAEDKVKVELTRVQGDLEQEKANTKQKVKEAEDKVKVELTRVQGELEQEKACTKQKVKEAEDKVKIELTRVQGELEQEKACTKQKVKEAEDKVKVELTRVQGELEQEKACTKRKVKEAEDKVKVELNRVQHALSIEKENTIRKIDIVRAEEREEKRKAVQIKEAEISQLKLDQKFYFDNFVRMEFAQKYAGLLKQLLEVANDVEKSANGLMEGDKMDDAYYLYRAQAKYNFNLSKLNRSNFLVEVEMIARGQLVFNDSAITKYDKKDPEGSIKKYFYSYYLEKYFNALVIFNETLSGLHLFDTKLSEKDVSVFNNLSQRIYDIASKLGIEIATVHIGEQNKYSDVQILDRVDVGLPSNSIVSIENCKVSVKGGSKSPVKIKVILQK